MPVADRDNPISAEHWQAIVANWNATEAPFPNQHCIHELFEQQVSATATATAVEDGERAISYGELNGLANQLARHLQTLGLGPDLRVAICMERSVEMVVGLLAVLKAGGAYVPLDPSYPPGRLMYMLTDSAPIAILTNSATAHLLSIVVREMPQVPPVVNVTQDAPLWAHQPVADTATRDLGLTSQHLAYVIYTSGSTGVPKGVMTEHRALVNRLCWMQSMYQMDHTDAVLQKTPFSFDVSVWEFLWTLTTGARLVMAKPQGHKDPVYLRRIIQQRGVTTLHFVPSMLQLFLSHPGVSACRSLKRVICSGEALPASLVRRFSTLLPDSRLFNLYGPTEAAIDVTEWEWNGHNLEQNQTPPIGRPIWNTRIYILNEAYQPVPPGVEGEIHIGGVGVARGYLNRPHLTAARFVASPFVYDRLYKTGDLGRFLTDGNIEYLGRNDFQLKINGCRIELGEIESRLLEHERVREVVVMAREHQPGGKRLVAYYTTTDDQEIPARDLHARLSGVLAQYMLPAAYLRLSNFPLNVNGKVDRSALPIPDAAAYDMRTSDRTSRVSC